MECECHDHTRNLGKEPQFRAEGRGERVDVAPLVRGEATGCDDFPEIGVSEYILILQWRQSGSGWERRAGLE